MNMIGTRRIQSALIGLLALFSIMPALYPVYAAEQLPLVATGSSFVESFEALDQTRWLISNGWSNGPYQDCTWSQNNVAFDGAGALELTLSDQPSAERPFTCAEIQSNELYGYGTFEVRMRSAAAPGLVTAFFTYIGPGHSQGQPHDEIDFEFLGKNRHSVQLNYFADGQGDHGHDVELSFDASQGANDYAFDWRPDSIRWFVNGRLVHEIRNDGKSPFPSHPGRIVLSIWNGASPEMNGWLEQFVYPGLPLVASYEHVQYTKMGEPCQTPNSLVCRLADH